MVVVYCMNKGGDIWNVFSERLKLLREAKNVTQVQLSTYLGVSQEAVSKYECSDTFPGIDIIIGIAKYFNVSIDYLLGVDNIKKRISLSDLNEYEVTLISYYRELDKIDQELAIKMISTVVEHKNKYK